MYRLETTINMIILLMISINDNNYSQLIYEQTFFTKCIFSFERVLICRTILILHKIFFLSNKFDIVIKEYKKRIIYNEIAGKKFRNENKRLSKEEIIL